MSHRVLCKQGTVVIERIERPRGIIGRMRGLLGRAALPADRALHLDPCRAVHTWGMRFSIDLIFLAKDGTVVRLCRDVGPGRMVSGGRRARSVVELESGWFDWDRLQEGDQVTFEPSTASCDQGAADAANGSPRREWS